MSELPVCEKLIKADKFTSLTCDELITTLLVSDCWAVVVYDKDRIPKTVFNQYMQYDTNDISDQKFVEMKRRQYYSKHPNELMKFREVHIYMYFEPSVKCVIDHYGRRAFFSE
jgi:hypothetical protein